MRRMVFGIIVCLYATAMPALTGESQGGDLVRNPSVEVLRNGLPVGYVCEPVPGTKVVAAAKWLVVEDAHTGKVALMVARTNVGGQFGIYPPFAKIPPEPRVRYFRAGVWLKARALGRPYIYIQCCNKKWSKGWFECFRQIAPQWEEYVLPLRLEKGDDLGNFRIKFIGTEVGDALLFDDFSLREISGREYERLKQQKRKRNRIRWKLVTAPKKSRNKGRNLVRNASFELIGFEHWGLGYSMGSCSVLERLKHDRTEHVHGRGSLRVDSLVRWYEAGMNLQSAPIRVVEGKVYTLSAYMKCNEPGVRVCLGLRNRGDKPDAAGIGCVLGNTWQRFFFSVRMGRCPGGRALINISTSTWLQQRDFSARKIWIDAVQFEEGGISDFQPAPVVEMAAASSLAHSVFIAGEPVRLITGIYAPETVLLPEKRSLRLRYEIEDVFGAIVDRVSFSISPGGRRKFEHAFQWRSPRLGGFCGHVSLLDGDKILARAINVFAVVPKLPVPDPGRTSVFGCHVNLSRPFFEVAERMGVRAVRLHEERYLRWNSLRWHAGDRYWYDAGRESVLRSMKRSGMRVAGVLELGVPWASTAPDNVAEFSRRHYPPKMAAWRTFVRDQVTHFRGLVDAWEVWNEPYLPCWWKGTAREYVAMLQTAYTVVKEVAPEVRVVGICGTRNPSGWVNDCLAAGALRYMDVLSYHDYLHPTNGGPEEFKPTWRQAIMSHQRALSAYGRLLPVWNSEGSIGSGSDSYYRDFYLGRSAGKIRLSPVYLVRGYVCSLAAGQERFYWYALMEDSGPARSGGLGMLEYNGRPKPVVPAYATAVKYLDGKSFALELKLGERTRCFVFSSKGESVAVIWNILGAAAVRMVFAESGVRVADLMGNDLPAKNGKVSAAVGVYPLYLTYAGSAVELSAAIKAAWPGGPAQ